MPLKNCPNCFPEVNTVKIVNRQLSEKIRKLVKAEEGKCAASVSVAFSDHREALPEDAVYVEGIWMVDGQPGIHAWIEAGNQIIDPTFMCLPLRVRNEKVPYYPICRLSWDEAHEHYRHQKIESGKLDLMLTWNNPKVEKVRHKVDPP